MYLEKMKADLRRMRGLPVSVVGKKLFVGGIRYLEGAGKRLWNSSDVSEKDLLDELGICSFSEIEEVMSESPCSFFIHPRNRSIILGSLQQYYPKATPAVLEEADMIGKHKIGVLGFGRVDVGRDIAWECDFDSGKRWSPKYSPLIRVGDINDHADIKVPWELSRFHHLIPMGKAYWFTGNERYVREIVRQIENWIERNPVGFGIHWTCAMEAAIRVVNWIWAYAFIRDAKIINEVIRRRFLRSILTHGKFIFNNLENKQDVINNHYLADLVGLIYIGTAFPQFQISSQWRDFALNEFFSQIKHQVLNDGVNFELSTGYHRLDLEMVISAVILGRATGYEIPLEIWQKIERMFEFVMYYTKPDGTVPQLGDDDDGRLHKLAVEQHSDGTEASKDHRYLLAVGAVLFNRNDFAWKAGKFWEEAFWLLGYEGLEKFHALLQKPCKLSLTSKLYENSGFYILRDDNLYMIVDCGRNGQGGEGGHNHNDTLGFELYAYDRTFVLDPGTYNYTGDIQWRNKFRSTNFHNVVAVDSKEINSFRTDECFRIRENAKVEVLQWVSDEEKDVLEAQHEGFCSLPGSPLHRRKIYFNKVDKFWLIEDAILGNGEHHCELFLHFPNLDVLSYGRGSKDTYIARSKESALLIHALDGDHLISNVSQGWISPSYGVKKQAPVLIYEKRSLLPVRFVTLLQPVENKSMKLDDYGPCAKRWFEKIREVLN